MKTIWKIIKWCFKLILVLLVLIILSGLACRLLGPAPNEPMGELVDIGGYSLHIVASGEKSQKPTVIIEAGAGLPTEFYYWLDAGLKDSLRVIRYDRAGLGYSDEAGTPRDPETIARELHTLLEKSGEAPPYIMVGHSMGGPHVRVFGQLYPEEVAALFFLDATHHEQVERFNAPEKSSFKYKVFTSGLSAQVIAADLGLVTLYQKLFGNPYQGEGLPDKINQRTKDFLATGKSFRAYKNEMTHYHATLKRSGEASDFGDIPIRSFTAEKSPRDSDDLDKTEKDYLDFEDLSTNGKHIEIVGNHTSIFTDKENAEIICKEIVKVSNQVIKERN